MSITKTRIKSAVINKQNDTNNKTLKGSTNALQTLDNSVANKGSPKNVPTSGSKILPLSTGITTNNIMGKQSITTTTILPQTNLLKIEPFVPNLTTRLQKPIRRSYSTLSNSTLQQKKRNAITQQHVNRNVAGIVGLNGNGVGDNSYMVSGLPNVLKQPVNNNVRRRPTVRGNIKRQRSKSTSSSNSNSNRPNTSAIQVSSTPSLGTPCSSPYAVASVIQQPNGICRIQRNVKDQEKLPDRINYDKRGLTSIPIFENETNLRLLSLQHNLINTFHIPKDSEDRQPAEQNDNKSDSLKLNINQTGHNLPSNTGINKQRFPLALTTPNVEQLQAQTSDFNTTFASLQRNKMLQIAGPFQMQTNSPNTKIMPQPNQLRFGMRKSQSFINNFNLQINLNKRVLQNQRMLMLRKSQGFNNLKSFDSSTSTLTTDSTNSTLLTNEIEDQLDTQLDQKEEEEEKINSLSILEVKNKQLIIQYGGIFENLVFLDLYDNQIEKVSNLDGLPALTVLLLGKNRISDISGLGSLKASLRVLDLHGNKLCSIANKINCLKELKSLNLAGNQIRQINHNDFLGLNNLKELNLKRNKLKRINGFQHLCSLERLWLCHNDLHKVDDMSSIAKAINLIEITIENNPLTLAGDCVTFLVSYLPKLQTLSQMPITEQVRKAAMTWRTNKELSESQSLHTNKEVFNIIRREEIISNARTNWELLRSQQMVQSSIKSQKPLKSLHDLEKITEDNEKNYEEFIKLPPIDHQQQGGEEKENSSSNHKKDVERSSSVSSLGPNVNSSSSCYSSQDEDDCKDSSIKDNPHDVNDVGQVNDANNRATSSSLKSKQQIDGNLKQTSTDNNHYPQSYSQQHSKCNPTTIRTPSATATATTTTAFTTSCAPTLNLQFPMENNKVSANPQNQTINSSATSVSSSVTCSIPSAATTAALSSNSSASVTQASTYFKRYMTGSLMRSQTTVGSVTGGVGGNGGSCLTSGYTVKTNTVATANNIRYQSKLNPNTGITQAAALATHQQAMTTTITTMTMTTTTTGNIVIASTSACTATISNNLISSSSVQQHGHNTSLTLNSNKTFVATTTAGPCGGGATSTKLTAIEREREQGGDYLIEICGRYLNIYGQGALRFIDKQWNPAKANDVHTLNFSYINFNNIACILGRIKVRFPHAENFVFRETNISSLGQLNALAEIQGISSLTIDVEGNPITSKDLWCQYAIYRLSHWGLKILNGLEVTDAEIAQANAIYEGLSNLILWSMPNAMLQPLLTRLRLDESCTASKMQPKQWLQKPDNKSLRLVVGKEALQWKKSNNQDQNHHQQLPTPQQVRQLQNQYYNNVDGTIASSQQPPQVATAGTSISASISSSTTTSLTTRERGKIHFTLMMENTCNAVEKLHKLEQLWPTTLSSIVRNTLLDYSQLDVYIRNLMAEIMK